MDGGFLSNEIVVKQLKSRIVVRMKLLNIFELFSYTSIIRPTFWMEEAIFTFNPNFMKSLELFCSLCHKNHEN